MTNERQAELFDELKKRGMVAGDLWSALDDISERQAYRLMTGDGTFTYAQARRLLHAWPDRLVNVLANDLLRDAHRIIIHVPDELASADVDRGAAATLRRMAEFIEKRAGHREDGVITESEQAEEIELIEASMQALHRLYHDVKRQRVAKPAKRKEDGPCLRLPSNSQTAS